MNPFLDRTLPFIAGVIVLLIGSHFHRSEILILGALGVMYGFWHLVKQPKTP